MRYIALHYATSGQVGHSGCAPFNVCPTYVSYHSPQVTVPIECICYLLHVITISLSRWYGAAHVCSHLLCTVVFAMLFMVGKPS